MPCGGRDVGHAQRTEADSKLDRLDEPTDAAGIVHYFQDALAAGRPALKRLQAIPLPSEERTQARRGVHGAAREVTALGEAITALKGGADPRATLQRFVKREGQIERTEDRAWRAVGATECAK